jgi:hypothetical protein
MEIPAKMLQAGSGPMSRHSDPNLPVDQQFHYLQYHRDPAELFSQFHEGLLTVPDQY